MYKLILLLSTLFLLTACSKPIEEIIPLEPTTYEKIVEMLNNLTTYQSTISVTYISNKSINEYELLKHVNSDGKYRIEVLAPESVLGNITISDTINTVQNNKSLGTQIKTASNNNQRSSLFITNFAHYFATNPLEPIQSDDETILRALLNSDNPYIHTQSLTFDNKLLTPTRLVTYDVNGEERIVVIFKNFVYNVTLEDSIFQIF